MRVVSIIFLFTFCNGCGKALISAYGVKDPKILTRDQISLRLKDLGIAENDAFYLDKNYLYALVKKDTIVQASGRNYSPMISKYIQPLQLMYFNESGVLLSFHNNCNAKGFPLLKWNSENQFNTFIPGTTIPITDSIVSLSFLLPHLQKLDGTASFQSSKWTVVVFWCDFMLKQSKELIKVARKNVNKSLEPTRIYYVNVDNCYADK